MGATEAKKIRVLHHFVTTDNAAVGVSVVIMESTHLAIRHGSSMSSKGRKQWTQRSLLRK